MLFRVITLSKWNKKISRQDAGIAGDAISDLRTTNNTLSVWKVSDKKDNDELLDLAVVAALNRDKLQKVSYVLLDESWLDDNNITFQSAPGKCDFIKSEYHDLKSKHIDLTEIDYKQLGILAEKISSILVNSSPMCFTNKELGERINALKKDGFLTDKFNDKEERFLN